MNSEDEGRDLNRRFEATNLEPAPPFYSYVRPGSVSRERRRSRSRTRSISHDRHYYKGAPR